MSTRLTSIPKTMKALQVLSPVPEIAFNDPSELSRYITLVDVPVPSLGSGEVLINLSSG